MDKNLGKIVVAVEKEFGVGRDEFLGSNAARCGRYSVKEARKTLFWAARKFTSLSLADIAQNFGCTHVAVLNAVKTVKKECAEDPACKDRLDRFATSLGVSGCGQTDSDPEWRNMMAILQDSAMEIDYLIHRIGYKMTGKVGSKCPSIFWVDADEKEAPLTKEDVVRTFLCLASRVAGANPEKDLCQNWHRNETKEVR